MSHRIGIVAHQARADAAHELQTQAHAAYLSMDNGTLGCEGNHRKVWTYLSKQQTDWGVVLEDDALPTPGFNTQLDQALTAAPTPIVGLYLGDPSYWGNDWPQRSNSIRHAAAQADHTDACFITTQHLIHGVGIAIHTDLIPDMLAHTQGTKRPFDYAITDWCNTTHLHISLTWPSLVDHADGPTLINHQDGRQRRKPRKAYRCGTRTEWTSKTVTM